MIFTPSQHLPEASSDGVEGKLLLRESVVRLRDADGAVRTIELDGLAAEQIRFAVPFRRLGSRPNQDHMPGWYWSATAGTHLGYESRLELACLLLADQNPSVAGIYSQPFQLVAMGSNGRKVRWVPDFLLVSDDASLHVVEVKPALRASKPSVAARLAAMAEMLGRFGIGMHVFTEPDPVQLTNIRFLLGFRRSRMFSPAILDSALAAVDMPMSIATAESRLSHLWPRPVLRPHLLHLLWRGLLEADMLSLLDSQSMVWGRR